MKDDCKGKLGKGKRKNEEGEGNESGKEGGIGKTETLEELERRGKKKEWRGREIERDLKG